MQSRERLCFQWTIGSCIVMIGFVTHCAQGVDPSLGNGGAGGSNEVTSTGVTAGFASTTGAFATNTTTAGFAATTTTAGFAATTTTGATTTGTTTSTTGASSSGLATSSSTTATSSSTSASSSSGVVVSGSSFGCLQTFLTSTPGQVCMGVHTSDLDKCKSFLACYINNACNPHLVCGTSNDGTCGVNTLHSDSAPRDGAVATFDTACGADAGPGTGGTGGVDAGQDSGPDIDAGSGTPDAGSPDASPADAGTANDATVNDAALDDAAPADDGGTAEAGP